MKRFLLLIVFTFAVAPMQAAMRVGVASADITPEHPIRLSGYGSRRAPSEGIAQRLQAGALAFRGEGDQAALLLTVDNVGVPGWLTEKVFNRVAAETKLPREQFAMCSSHTHTAPMIAGVLSNLFGMDIPDEQWKAIEQYTRQLEETLVEISLKALRETQPAEMHWGIGRARFAKNRRTDRGPVDHDLPVLAAKNAKGEWIAILANYACHCTTLGGEFNRQHGDWAGCAREFLEQAFPTAKALIAIGCGADANPFPRGGVELAERHGRELADEAARLLRGDLKRLEAVPKGAFARFNLAFDKLPTRAEWEERAKQGGAVAYHAKRNLERLDRGETLPSEMEYSLQTLAFGDELAMIFMPGEVVVDYALRIKRAYDPRRVWVNAYANDVPCYIPSKRIWAEGGYEGGGAMVYYDRPTRLAEDTEERIFAQLEKLVPAAFKVAEQKNGAPAPKTPEEALKTIQTRPGLKVELVASEPLIVDPVAIDFGPDGRLWVIEMHDYPSGMDGKYKPGGRVKVLSSSDGKRFDTAQTLADDLPFPTGVMAWKKGALVCAAPDILYIEDSDGDGTTDVRRKLYSGFSTENYQARVNGLRWGLDGWVYGAAGLFGGTIQSHLTGKTHKLSGRDFRIKPDTGEFEQVAGLSQQGRVRDDFANWFGCDNGTWAWHFPIPDHYFARNPAVAFPDSKVRVANESTSNEVYPISVTLERFNDPDNANRATSVCGIEIYRDRALGSEYYGHAFVPEPVHNLVHRLSLQPSGSTFKGARASGEEHSEFLASTDNWFRPVEVRTGPDGALWIVDMYRFVIEHPRWISAERLSQLDVRAGADKGRIYRVRSEGVASPMWGDLAKASSERLFGMLSSENGVMRDLAHRLLLERNEVPSLASDGFPAARVQRLHLRNQKGALTDEELRDALRDRSDDVRIHAIQLAERRPGFAEPLAALAEEKNPALLLQLALSLGEFSDGAAGEALGKIALRTQTDPRIRAAILSSASKHADVILAKLLENRAAALELIDGLVRTAAASSNQQLRSGVLDKILRDQNEPFESWKIVAARSLLKTNVPTTIRARVRAAAEDSKLDLKGRQAAFEILAQNPIAPEDLPLFAAALNDPALRKISLAALGSSNDRGVADLLFAGWNSKAPSLRGEIIDELLKRERSTDRLLAALESNEASLREIGPTQRQRLLRHSSAEIATRAAKLFADATSDRDELVKRYERSAGLNGNPNRGLMLFADNCASCHAFHGLGHALGPDLNTYRDKPVADWLLAILHPNAVVEPRFLNYNIETSDDRSLAGILTGETATSFTLAQANGITTTLLRADVTSIKASNFSLMPEGLEAAVDPQGMADLIAYLKTPEPAAFAAARESGKDAPRQQFLKTAANPITKIVSATEALDYPSWAGASTFYHCRQSDGNGRVEWEVAAPTGEGFEIPAALGFISQPQGAFTLHANGEKALDFDVTLKDACFGEPGAAVRASYRVLDRNVEDGSGVFAIRFPLHGGKPVRFAVTGNAANSQRWFGIYDLNAPKLSAVERLRELTRAPEPNKRIPEIWRVAIDAAKHNDPKELREILEASLPTLEAPLEEWQAVVIGGGVINGISQVAGFPAKRINEIIGSLESRWRRSLQLSVAMSHDAKVIPGTRYDALRMAALLDWRTARKTLEPFLKKDAHPELQQGAVSGLLDVENSEAADLLNANLGNLTEGNRKIAEEGLRKR